MWPDVGVLGHHAGVRRASLTLALVSITLAFVACWRAFGWKSGEVANWFSGVGSIGAALAALWIATRDRRDRRRDQLEEQNSHARLVQLSVAPSGGGYVNVEVRNYGPLPVLDIDLIDAAWSEHPQALQVGSAGRFIRAEEEVLHRPILMPHPAGHDDAYNTVADFTVTYFDAQTHELLAPIDTKTVEFLLASRLPIDVSQVSAKIRFTSADGVRWETLSEGRGSGDPVRIPASRGEARIITTRKK